MTRLSARSLALLVVAGMVLSGCGIEDWFSSTKTPPLPGKRVSVLLTDQTLQPDPHVVDVPVTLPTATANEMWPQPGGYPDHSMQQLVAGATTELWHASFGTGTTSRRRLMARPVIAEGRVYTMDSEFTVSAFDAKNGERLWETNVLPDDDSGDGFGGGVAFADGKLFVTSGYGDVLTLDPATGKEGWRHNLSAPIRAGATVADGRVFVVTVDNQLFALQASDGTTIWTHNGILESAGLLNTTSPAVADGVVVVPYSSGEIFGLRVENGRVVWSDNLTVVRRVGALANLADVSMPVIDHGLVIAVSHSGHLVAIDERGGSRVWDQELGGIETPWLAGDFVFMLDNDQHLVALTRQAGRVRWVSALDRWENPDDKTDPITWAGPVLGSGKLWLVSSTGQLIGVDAQTGTIIEKHDLPDGASLAPVIANGTLYVVTDGGTLVAYR
ncbi:MAG: PQQ-binding-like beta-propeller repeat protein [Azospirillaceae bacterium]|nr:PQQ-binding-like beta-propeller repeat protein [Azospirillaceae bacterium]